MRAWWHRITGRSPLAGVRETDGDEAPGLALDALQATMLEEFRGLRKTLRKQAQAVEAVRDRLDRAPEPRRNEENGEELMRLAAAFFHLDQALLEVTACSPRRQQAVALVWLQLDPRLHRAVLARTPEARDSVVTEMLEPGFMVDGAVRQPARVVLGPAREHEPEALPESGAEKPAEEQP